MDRISSIINLMNNNGKRHAIVAIAVIYAFLILYVMIREPEKVLFENKMSNNDSCWINKDLKSKRVIVILIDSLKPDYLFNSTRMPFTSSLKDKSAWGYASVSGAPITISCDKAIFCGYNDKSLFSIYSDFNSRTVETDNIFKRLAEAGKKSYLISTADLYDAFGKYTITSEITYNDGFKDYERDTENIFNKAKEYLPRAEESLIVIQICGLDYVGHIYTPKSEQYEDLLNRIDIHLKNLLSELRVYDTVIITSEHGMDDNSFHLESTPDVVNPPFIIFGPDIVLSGPMKITQEDLAPTLSILLGIYPFYSSQSFPVLDMIKSGSDYKKNLLDEYSNICNLNKDISVEEIDKLKNTQAAKPKNMMICAVILVISILLIVCYIMTTDELGKQILLEKSITGICCALIILAVTIGLGKSGLFDMISDRFHFQQISL